jgi:hypothetical protein
VVEYDKLKDQEVGFGEWIKPKIGGIAVKIKMGSSVEKAFGVSGEVQGAIQVLKVIIDLKNIYIAKVLKNDNHYSTRIIF